MGAEVTEVALEEQSLPKRDFACPYCGSPASEESVVKHRLSNNGYLHDDITLVCERDDAHKWTHGVPIGEHDLDFGDELACPVCTYPSGLGERVKRWVVRRLGYDPDPELLVHRAQVQPDNEYGEVVSFHLKCPRCYFFETTQRVPDESRTALVGYPAITGQTTGAQKYGYR